MDPYIDSAGITGLAPHSATLYAVGHNVDPSLQIVFSYCFPDASWVHPVESNYHAGTGAPHQPVYCVMHRQLIPARLYTWQCEIRDAEGHPLKTTGPQSFSTPPEKSATNQLFMPGNRFWEYRSSFGTKPVFPSPDALWQACCEYFVWVDEHPLWEDNVISYKGEATHEPLAKMRAMTYGGMCTFLGVSQTVWSTWRKTEMFADVVARVDEIIRTQKFQGAAAGLLNPSFIARDLGLADRQEHTGKDGGPIVSTVELDAERFTRAITNMASRSEQPEETPSV